MSIILSFSLTVKQPASCWRRVKNIEKLKKKTVRNKMHDQFALIFFEWDYATCNDENNNMLFKWNQFYGNSLDWSLGCNVLVSFLKNSCNKNVASL